MDFRLLLEVKIFVQKLCGIYITIQNIPSFNQKKSSLKTDERYINIKVNFWGRESAFSIYQISKATFQ